METLVIACGMIKDEMNQTLKTAGKDYPAVFLKPGLDDDPQALREAIAEEMDKLAEPSLVLLGYGFSNGALVDFPAGRHTLAAPQAEDSICIVLGSQARRDALLKESPTYFITDGWMRGDALFKNYERAVEKYGPEKAAKLQKSMMGHYKRFLLIDTGVYDLDKWRPRLEEMAGILGMTVEEAPGDLSLLARLVSGPPWGHDIVQAGPGEMLTVAAKVGE